MMEHSEYSERSKQHARRIERGKISRPEVWANSPSEEELKKEYKR